MAEHYASSGDSSHRWVWAAQILLLVGVVGFFVWGRPRETPSAPLPVLSTLPEFTLASARGERVTREDLRGTVWIADFIFTRCGGQCLDMTSRMRDLRRALENDPNVKLVSITVNPTYDSAEVLQNYARRHDAVTDKWLFLTGSRDAIYALANEGFKLAADEATEEEQAQGADMFLHSVRFVLVDGQGRIRGYYNALESDALHRLLADARRLAGGLAA